VTFPIPNYTLIKVRGHFVDLAKAARGEASYGLTGPVQFIPTPIVAINQGSQQIIEMKPFVVFPNAQNGYFEVLLPSTDDPDVVPQEWNYHVIEPTGRSYYIVVPYDTPQIVVPEDPDYLTQVIDLVDVVPDPDADAGTIQLLHGRPGRDITSVYIDDADNHLRGTYSDGVVWDAGVVDGVQTVNGRPGVVTLSKSDVGLSAVANTSDANKPVSTATQAALDGKANATHTHAASGITSGTLNIARIPTGTSSTTVAIGNHTHTGMVSSPDVTTIDVLTQAAYDAITTKDPATLYVVVG